MKISGWAAMIFLGSASIFPVQAELRMLALGDSYTHGEGVDEAQRWPVQLVTELRREKISVSDPLIIARSGWTTDELSFALDRKPPIPPFDFVFLLIGSNNQFRGRSVEEYRTQFVALLKRSLKYADNKNGRVVVLSLPDWGATPFAEGRDPQQIAGEIDQFNKVNREEAKRLHAHYVDITPLSRATTDESMTVEDGLHPSAKMYGAWAKLVLPVVLTEIRKK